jgi:hypothetical protein
VSRRPAALPLAAGGGARRAASLPACPWLTDALPARAHAAAALPQGKKQDYTYRLMTKVSAYNGGLVSPTGYYKLNVQGGQYTTFTYWWQARAPRRVNEEHMWAWHPAHSHARRGCVQP